MSTFDKVKEVVIDKLGVDEAAITEEAHFVNDLGADSLDTVELIMEFEEEFGIEIPDEEAENIDISKMRNDLAIFDVGEKTIEEICNTASMCKTIFWNGPLGVYETPPFDNSTNIIGRTIAILTKGKLVLNKIVNELLT